MKFSGLIWAAVYRKPIRSSLTLGSLFVAFLLFGLLHSVSVAFTQGVDFAGVDRLIVAPKYSIIDDIPLNYQRRIAGVDGVELIAYRSWFGGTYQNNKQFFSRWPVPPKEFLDIYPEFIIADEQREAFISTRTGAIVGRDVATAFDLKVGDRMPLIPNIWMNKDNGPWVFDLVGIFDGADESVDTNQMFMSYDFFDEYRTQSQGGVGTFVVRITDPDRTAAIAAEIDAMFANSSDETKTTTEKAYNQMFANQLGDIGFIMTGILSAVFFTILLLTGNTMAQAIRERIPELAILKTVGFSNVTVLILVLCESLLIALLGCIPGLLVASMLMPALSGAVPFFGDVQMTPLIYIQGILLALALGVIVGLPPAVRAMKLNIVDALGEHAA
ncbi:MAG TPA: hypothetical protein DCM54_11920 [Gammaproteobacteria bacterium]|nr:hypothetical protein [Gammaproteobacteria bacterium]